MTTTGYHQQRKIDAPRALVLMFWAVLSNPLVILPPLLILALAFGLHFISLNLDQMLLGLGALPEPLTERQVVGMWMLRITPFGPLVFIIPLFILSACIVAREIAQSPRVSLLEVIRGLLADAFRAIAIAIMSALRALPTAAVLAGCAFAGYHYRDLLAPVLDRNFKEAVVIGGVGAFVLFFITAQILITPFVAFAGNLSAREAHSTSRFVISRRLGGMLLLVVCSALGGYYFLLHRHLWLAPISDPLLRRYLEIAVVSGVIWILSGVTHLLCVGALDEIATSHLHALRAHTPMGLTPLVERATPVKPATLPADFLVERDDSKPARAFARRGAKGYFPQTSLRNPSRPEPTR